MPSVTDRRLLSWHTAPQALSRQTVGRQLTHASGLSAHWHAAASLPDADSSEDARADDAGASD